MVGNVGQGLARFAHLQDVGDDGRLALDFDQATRDGLEPERGGCVNVAAGLLVRQRHAGALADLLLGSIATRVIHLARVPVLLGSGNIEIYDSANPGVVVQTLTLAAGVVVVFATVTGTREARMRDYAVLRALGATQVLLGRVQRAELIGVGALAGALASAVALVLGWVLAHRVFEFEWSAPVWVPGVAVCGGALLAWAAGWWGLRGVLRRPVVSTLRESAN